MIGLNMSKKSLPLSIRLPKPHLDYLRKSAEISCRNVSGQTGYMLGIAIILQTEYPELFNEISSKINEQISTNIYEHLKKMGGE